jgi:hypothetical protein
MICSELEETCQYQGGLEIYVESSIILDLVKAFYPQ